MPVLDVVIPTLGPMHIIDAVLTKNRRTKNNLKKVIIAIVACVLIIVLGVLGFFYISAYITVADLEREANGPITEDSEPIPENIISAENFEKLCHVTKKNVPEKYFLDGGISFPLIYPHEDGFKMHYVYDYKVVDAKKNELVETVKGSVMTLEIDYVDGDWIVCEVGEEFKYRELIHEKLFGTDEKSPTAGLAQKSENCIY